MSKTKTKPTSTKLVARYRELRSEWSRWRGRRGELDAVAALIPVLGELRTAMRSVGMDPLPLHELERALHAGHWLTSKRSESCAALVQRVDAIVEDLAERLAETTTTSTARPRRPAGCPAGFERLVDLCAETKVSHSTAHGWIDQEAFGVWRNSEMNNECWVNAQAFRAKAANPRRRGRQRASR